MNVVSELLALTRRQQDSQDIIVLVNDNIISCLISWSKTCRRIIMPLMSVLYKVFFHFSGEGSFPFLYERLDVDIFF